MNLPDFPTIVAIATPSGYGGIGIVRLSGASAVESTRTLLPAETNFPLAHNQASFHRLINSSTGQVIDEAVLTYFRAPHSFTGEDVVEISCHGSPVVLAEVVRLLIVAGAEASQAGEFSLRAFLNGRIDLAQAEAINDIIHAQTTNQARVAARQLRGELSLQLAGTKRELIDLIVHLESAVEFVEDDLDSLNLNHFISKIDGFIDGLSRLAATYRVGRLVRSGIKLALIGRPNVGKSSLFNALLGFDRAIVTDLPGTTRDTLNETLSIGGIPVSLIDTAGIRETQDIVEGIGVERTKTAIAEADLIVAVLEATAPLTDEEKSLLNEFPVHLIVINKSDLGMSIPLAQLDDLRRQADVIDLSALTGVGIDALKAAIENKLLRGAQIEDAIITTERHFQALEQTLAALKQAKQDLSIGFTEEVALANLHAALKSLGLITGETLIGDLINQIFATFCIGK